jgi:biotin carboxyl carrier protein
MSIAAQMISMTVRPFYAAHLAFEVDGILGESNIELGTEVAAFDFAAFYAILGAMPTLTGHPARLLYDFLVIQSAVKPFTLAALRAEPRKAALSKAINARANAFYAKYANAPAIITQIQNYYSPGLVGAKPQRLEVLDSLADAEWFSLKNAYTTDNRTGVVRTTESFLHSQTVSHGSSTDTGQSDVISVRNLTPNMDFPAPPPGGGWTAVAPTGAVDEIAELASSGEDSASKGGAVEHEKIVNKDYGYKNPYVEAAAQYERAKISLIDQQFAQFMAGQNLPYLDAVFLNELNSMDSDVYRVQMAYLNTILMSPIAGRVTGVYKNRGDAVKAGEPVVRVENDSIILLVATLKCPGPIAVGSGVTITTTALFGSSQSQAIFGSVVSARGGRDEELWEVIVKCNNPLGSNGKPVFPLGYQFDYDDTPVTIS